MLTLLDAVEAAGLTIHRDHASPAVFHYLPANPRIVSHEDRPAVQLLAFRGEHSGGFLTFEVDCSVPEEQLAAARSELSERFGVEAHLQPVPFHEGTVRLSALGVRQGMAGSGEEPPVTEAGGDAPDADPADGAGGTSPGPQLVERIVGSATPSLLGGQQASFALELSPEGVTLVQAALEGKGSPLIVAYDLTYRGLQPARDLAVTIDAAMAYDHLRAQGKVDSLWVRADLARETESLMRSGAIRVEAVSYGEAGGEAPAVDPAAALRVANEYAGLLFWRPSASPQAVAGRPAPAGDPVAGGGARAGRTRLAFRLRALEQDELQTFRYDLSEAGLAERRVAPQGPLDAPDGVALEQVDRDTFLDTLALRAFCPDPAAWEGVDRVIVDLRCGDEVRSLQLTPEAPDARTLVWAGELEHRVHVFRRDGGEVLGEPEEPPEDPPWEALDTRTLVIDPAGRIGRRALDLRLGVMDPETVSRVGLRLIMGERSIPLVLDADTSTGRIGVFGREPVTLEASFHTAEGEVLTESREIGPDDPVVVINQPPSRWLVVEANLVDPLDRYSAVHVEIEGLGRERPRVLELSREIPSASWSLLRPADAQVGYRYRVTHLERNGGTRVVEWAVGRAGLLLVGDSDVALTRIQGWIVGADDHVGAVIVLSTLEPPEGISGSAERFLDAGVTTFEATLPRRRGGSGAYRVEAQVFTVDGDLRMIGPLETSDEILLLSAIGV